MEKVALRTGSVAEITARRWAALGRPAAVITKDKVSMEGKNGMALAKALQISLVDLTKFLSRVKVDTFGPYAQAGTLTTVNIFNVEQTNVLAHQIYRAGNTLNVGSLRLASVFQAGNTKFALTAIQAQG
jgi:hypothetical protein